MHSMQLSESKRNSRGFYEYEYQRDGGRQGSVLRDSRFLSLQHAEEQELVDLEAALEEEERRRGIEHRSPSGQG